MSRPPRARGAPSDQHSAGFPRVRHVLQLALVALCLGTAGPVEAAELIVEWTAPPECPEKADVVSDLERLLEDAANVNLTATATVTRAADGFRARVRITSAAGQGDRVLEDARCELLAESVALVIALSAPHVPGARRAEEPDDGLAPALSVHAAAVMGPLPEPALGAGGALAIEGISALRLELSGAYYAHQSSSFDAMDIGARFQLLALGLRMCRIWALGAIELAPCLGAQFYRIAGKGFGGMVSRDGASLALGPALGVLGRARLQSQLALYVTLDGVVLISRRRFVFSDVGPLHRPSAFAFQLFVGPEVRF